VLALLLQKWAPPARVLTEAAQEAAHDGLHEAFALLYRQLALQGMHVGMALPQASVLRAASDWVGSFMQRSAEQRRPVLQQWSHE
jgi:hypothetical protein